MNVTTISSVGDHPDSGLGALVRLFKNVYNSRSFIFVLYKRDFFGVYRKSFLGLLWLVLTPVLGVASWILMDHVGVLKPGSIGIPYPAYVLLSTTIWTLFVGSYSAAADTLNTGSAFIMQVKYPHEVLLVKQLLQHLTSSAINCVVVFAVIGGFGVSFSWPVFFLPLLAIPFLLLGGGIGLLVSVTSVVVPEIRKISDIVINFLIFVTPVIYAPSVIGGSFGRLLEFNPLSYLVDGTRSIILHGIFPNPSEFWISCACGFLLFVVALRVFYLSERYVLEKMI